MPPEEKNAPAQTERSELGDAIENFAENLAGLREFEKLVGSLLSDQQRTLLESRKRETALILIAVDPLMPEEQRLSPTRYQQLVDNFGTGIKIVREGNNAQISFDDTESNAADAFSKLVEDLAKSRRHQSLLYRSALISLVSAAEWFVAQIIRGYLQKYSGAAGTKEKSLSLEDLKKIGSIDEARKFLIELKIDEIMRGSFEDWIEYLASHMKLSMGYLKPFKEEMIEIFQRRNVMVHNNGIVHSSYIYKVAEELRPNIKAGDKIGVNRTYLSRAIDLLERNFILIGAELWKQLVPNDGTRGDCLVAIAFSRLRTENWLVAEGLSYFTKADRNLSEQFQMIGTLNYWQTLKWQNKFDSVVEEVRTADFSAKDELYQAARFLLLNEVEKFFELLPNLLKAGKLDYEKLTTWPIFREVKDDPRFKKIVQDMPENANNQERDALEFAPSLPN